MALLGAIFFVFDFTLVIEVRRPQRLGWELLVGIFVAVSCPDPTIRSGELNFVAQVWWHPTIAEVNPSVHRKLVGDIRRGGDGVIKFGRQCALGKVHAAANADAHAFTSVALSCEEIAIVEEDKNIAQTAAIFGTHQTAFCGTHLGFNAVEVKCGVAEADKIGWLYREKVMRSGIVGFVGHNQAAAIHAQIATAAFAHVKHIAVSQFDVGAEEFDDNRLRILPMNHFVGDFGDVAVEKAMAVIANRAGHQQHGLQVVKTAAEEAEALLVPRRMNMEAAACIGIIGLKTQIGEGREHQA